MSTKGYFLPFLVALVIFAGGFLALDAAVMNMQGLNLFFEK